MSDQHIDPKLEKFAKKCMRAKKRAKKKLKKRKKRKKKEKLLPCRRGINDNRNAIEITDTPQELPTPTSGLPIVVWAQEDSTTCWDGEQVLAAIRDFADLIKRRGGCPEVIWKCPEVKGWGMCLIDEEEEDGVAYAQTRAEMGLMTITKGEVVIDF